MAKYTVDYPAQKVTVTGNVNRDQVLKRILKTGKHAEVEPEKSQKQEARKEDKKLVEPKEEKKKLEVILYKFLGSVVIYMHLIRSPDP